MRVHIPDPAEDRLLCGNDAVTAAVSTHDICRRCLAAVERLHRGRHTANATASITAGIDGLAAVLSAARLAVESSNLPELKAALAALDKEPRS